MKTPPPEGPYEEMPPVTAGALMSDEPYLAHCRGSVNMGRNPFPPTELTQEEKVVAERILELLYDPVTRVTLDSDGLRANYLGLELRVYRRLLYCEYSRQRAIAYAQQLAAENLPDAVRAATNLVNIPSPTVQQAPHVLKAASLLAQLSGATTPQARPQRANGEPGAQADMRLEVLVRHITGQDPKPVIIDQEGK